MKKTLKIWLVFSFLIGAFGELQAQTKTPNLGMVLPPAAVGSWGEDINNNLIILDSAVGGVGCQPVGTSILKGNGSGGCANAVSGTDYETAGGSQTKVDTHANDASAAHAASAIAFTPNGSVAAVTAQEAIQEVRDEAAGTGACTNQVVTGTNANTAPSCATVNSARMAVVNTRRVCGLVVGDGTNVVADADFSPFKNARCYMPYAATIREIVLQGDAGTPTVMVQRRRDAATLADLLSGNLAGAGTTETCATAAISTACINGTTSSGTITLANMAILAGDWIEIKSGVAGGVATNLGVMVVMTVD